MRKNICIILVMATFVLLIGCNKELTSKNPTTGSNGITNPSGSTSKEPISTSKIEDYYPFKKDVKYMYAGIGNEYATYTVNVDYLSGNLQQIRTDNGGSEVVKVLQIKDGELRIIMSKGEVYYRENFTSKVNDKPEILLKEPLTKGNTWTLLDGSIRTITNLKVDITTPLDSYECIEVSTVKKNNTIKEYYAANIGLVKTISTSNGVEVSSSLSKIIENTPLLQNVKFYYPNGNDGINYITDKKLRFNTNDITKEVFRKSFMQAPNESLGGLISANTKIKSLYLNSDNMVYIDFSKEFRQKMNAGSGYESQILQCITNTLGDYYMVKKVYITVEGEPYSSSHIAMKKGEAFIVDYKNTK